MAKAEAADYLEKAKERLRAARLLASKDLWDDATSRAYYAALYAARSALCQEGVDAKSHDGTVVLFGSHFVKRRRVDSSMGTVLSRLRAMREKAEYSPAFRATKENATWATESAERFVVEIERLFER